jgi:hypothetical protein
LLLGEDMAERKERAMSGTIQLTWFIYDRWQSD